MGEAYYGSTAIGNNIFSHKKGGYMPIQSISCPVCGGPMRKERVCGNVEIDFCDMHGVWLDVGEMERILADSGSVQRQQQSIGGGIVKNLAGAAVVGAGMSIGHRLVGGMVSALFNRR